jgi:sigma-B regulation protein RsbU (phosphoserine phosphatase)
MPRRRRILYCFLAFCFLISISYRIREISDRLDLLFHGTERVRDPFNIGLPGREVLSVQPEATAAGIDSGDVLVAFAGRPYTGGVDLYTPLRTARAGDRVPVTVSSNGAPKSTSIELQPYRETAVGSSEAVQQIVSNIMPVLCLFLGFWVAAARIQDPRAWIFLAMMISIAEINAGLVRSWLGHDDFFQPIGIAYQLFASNILGATMLFFGVYFPERASLDRRFPWIKWLITGPMLLRAAQIAAGGAFLGRHVEMSIAVDRLWNPPGNTIVLLHTFAVGCFLALILHKTFAAKSRDARRRLLLLCSGASVSILPAFVVILINIARGLHPFEPSTLFLIAVFVMIVGFPFTMAYVIVVERAMDVRVVIRQGIQYMLASRGVLIMQVLLSAMVIFAAASLSADGRNRPQRIQLIAFGIGAVALIRLIANKLRAWIDRRFFREAYDAEQILSDLANKVRTMVETEPLLHTVTHRISESLHVPRIAVLLNGGDRFRIAYALGYPSPPDVAISAGETDLENVARHQLGAELVLPLSLNQKILGILSLGPKRSEEPYSKADIRLLGSVATQTGLALENSRLAQEIAAEVAQRERMNREIEIAREVQERLFPQELPEIQGLEYAGYCRPASGVGGDYYDFLALPGGRLGIAIGDVSGKGIPAALLMASLRASLRGQTIQGAMNLATLMTNVNKLIYESSTSNRYATFFYAEFDPTTRTLSYVNGGHNPPLVFRHNREIVRLETGGPVVGLLPMFIYEQASIVFNPGDMFVAFTDGISEAMNAADEEWSEARLIESAWKIYGTTPPQAVQALINDADGFVAGAKQHDDMTIIVARVM